MKKVWVKPELIVLARSKPEEAVLATCKDSNYGGFSGPAGDFCADYSGNCNERRPS